jgi:two-component system, OmpR family, phosphate regulon sensor histidine kinase PhoR
MIWKKIINAPNTNPDTTRRIRLLNIILVGLAIATSVVMFLMAVVYITGFNDEYGLEPTLFLLCFATLTGSVAMYAIGRYVSGELASTLFLILFTTLLFFGDTPLELISGRSSSFFVLPIMMASMLIRPSASFIAMGIIFVLQSLVGYQLGYLPNFLIAVGYFMTALISWLSAHTLEQVIKELRITNQALDQRVEERTHTLNETLLREASESSRNRAILRSISDSVLVFNPGGNLISANPAVSGLTGLTPEEMSGKTLLELVQGKIPPEDQEKVRQSVYDATQTAPFHVTWGDKVYSTSHSPVALETGQQVGVVVVFHDVTPEVEVGRMKSAFVAMVSHELRTPLSALMGLIEILQHNLYGTLTEKQSDIVTRLLINSQKLAHLVEDLLDHAKMEAGTLTMHITAFSPRELLHNALDVLNNMAKNKNLTLIKEIDTDFPVALMGDERRLNQILTNLVTNAIKYTDEGEIRVYFKCGDRTHWQMVIQDTGVGFPPDAISNLFTPFWQADSSIARRQGGVGLGLSIVKRLVTLMQGEIFLESEPGKGSTFTVVLPLQEPGELTGLESSDPIKNE